MTDKYWTSRPKRRNWKGWLLALAAIAMLGSMCALSFNAESAAAARPPWPHDRAWCKYAPHIDGQTH